MSKNAGVAIVTGATSGIGRAFAERLAARQHSLLLVARRSDRLEAIASGLKRTFDVEVQTLVADLTRSEDVDLLVARITAADVTMLVNNAGAGGLGPSATVSAETLQSIISLNVAALTKLSQAALARFRERDAGTLVNISSILAQAPNAGAAAYSGSKAYVLNFTRSLQLEYARSRIRIQVILPGPVRTEFFSSQGISDAIFPDETFVTAEQLVDAALDGLQAGEQVTVPTMIGCEPWAELELARVQFIQSTLSGRVAARYASSSVQSDNSSG